MDSYLGGELLVETNHEVLHHLENCPACRSELAARRSLLAQMRTAVKNAPEAQINHAFAVKLRNDLRQTALRPGILERLKIGSLTKFPIFAAAAAMCLLVGILFGAAVLLRQTPISTSETAVVPQNTNEIFPETGTQDRLNGNDNVKILQAARREMTQSAIGDHKNCALHYRLKQEPITLTEAAEKYGRFNKDLDKTVIAALKRENLAGKDSGQNAPKIEFLEAHSCVFNERRFAHIVLKQGNKTISVLVTDNSFGENDETLINRSEENLQIAEFSARHHPVFVVSDLIESQNSTLAAMLSPAIRRHIELAEA